MLKLPFRVWKLIPRLLLLQSTEQVASFCRSLHDMTPLECPMSSSSSSSSSSLSPSPVSALPPTPGPAAQRQLSHADKLRKVINELVETERTYVKVSVFYSVEWKLSGINKLLCSSSTHPGLTLSVLSGPELSDRTLPDASAEGELPHAG